jgi:hypothetical protein
MRDRAACLSPSLAVRKSFIVIMCSLSDAFIIKNEGRVAKARPARGVCEMAKGHARKTLNVE